jgi:hypothetical protein
MASDLSIPVYLKARTADDLMLAMAKNNRKHGMTFRYFDIQYTQDRWFAWFYLDKAIAMKQRVDKLFGNENKRELDG